MKQLLSIVLIQLCFSFLCLIPCFAQDDMTEVEVDSTYDVEADTNNQLMEDDGSATPFETDTLPAGDDDDDDDYTE